MARNSKKGKSARLITSVPHGSPVFVKANLRSPLIFATLLPEADAPADPTAYSRLIAAGTTIKIERSVEPKARLRLVPTLLDVIVRGPVKAKAYLPATAVNANVPVIIKRAIDAIGGTKARFPFVKKGEKIVVVNPEPTKTPKAIRAPRVNFEDLLTHADKTRKHIENGGDPADLSGPAFSKPFTL